MEIYNGRNLKFWFDIRHPLGRLIDLTSEVGIQNLGIPKDAAICDVLRENKWYFRSCRDPSIRLIVSQIKAFPIVMSNDPIIVWFPQNVPRFAFITWLAIKDRLATSHRMQRWGQRHDFFVSSVESQMKQEITSSPVHTPIHFGLKSWGP
ncbi:hypothetical protein IGI04_000775 [Brassica rapa subsp. trilocularis]|uniref:Reverse transcriptase zinc-binding domain-containing protein n=1 Tax=Brassica rapa subsp. trilocularis TaxID=1813537 RepID=A0ABQ7NQR8_BRACM|nr:hypothetical protein IGI04_000775 [Brassica rapa subsp. trilocularis]